MSLDLNPDTRASRWTFEGGQIYQEGTTSAEWGQQPEIIAADGGYHLWRDIPFKPKWRKYFAGFLKCGVHNILMKLDKEFRFKEINHLCFQLSKYQTGPHGQQLGRQFLAYIILAQPDGYQFNYDLTTPKYVKQDVSIQMSVSGPQGSSPFSKGCKYYNAHTFKYGQSNQSKVDNKARR